MCGRELVLAVVVGAAVVACGTDEPPAPPPQELRLDGRKPCELLTEQQRAGFELDLPPEEGQSPGLDVPTCSFGSSAGRSSVEVTPVARLSLDQYQARLTGQDVRKTGVAGYPAVEVFATGLQPPEDDSCSVAVEVATNQVLEAAAFDESDTEPIGREQLCSRATRVAETVLGNLRR